MATDHRWIEQLLDRFDRLALDAFRVVETETKRDGSAVTSVDRAASRMMEKALRLRFPQDGILSEEAAQPHLPDAERLWVLDPLDGTAGFARGFPAWGLGLGLLEKGVPVEGYLSFPLLGERCFFSGGTFLFNGREFRPPPSAAIPDTRNVLIGSGTHGQAPLQRLGATKLRNYGSAIYHIAAVAMGRAEAVITSRCKIWDLVPALPFSRARGCVELFLDGSPFVLQDLLKGDPPDYGLPQPLVIGPPGEVELLLKALA